MLVGHIPIRQEIIDLMFGFQLSVTVPFLQEARQPIAVAGDLIHFVIRQLTPLSRT